MSCRSVQSTLGLKACASRDRLVQSWAGTAVVRSQITSRTNLVDKPQSVKPEKLCRKPTLRGPEAFAEDLYRLVQYTETIG